MASRARGGILGLVFDIAGLLVSILVAFPPIPRVWKLHDMADISLARRCQWWLFASLLHSITSIMIVVKDLLTVLKEWKEPGLYLHLASLLTKFLGPLLVFLVSMILLASLAKHYPITQDVLITRFIVGYICIGYVLILLTDFICRLEDTVVLELILIPVTICMHTLRFTTQGPLLQFQTIPFILSLLGIAPGALCLIPLGETFFEHLLKRLAFKIATLVAASARGLDAIALSRQKSREAANYFRSRLQECFW